ncbi:MAG: 50S ribosomal protein L15 [Acidobacteria bacterium]|nr:50S ribosomal protein L15 [Acidobacteriota bacterium]MCH8128536.1 50S ribosomal protein L15 [Acidobacteriota bacterium]MCH8899751.1 50S ribosomal protein L15 [Acidobacteriota bacterium]MCH8990464.1 50S ribosomal protein L15 [Acidobacteriota bacterium]
MRLQLHHLRPAEGSKKRKIRVGRGEAGRRGKTAGRGTKGLKARSKVRRGFEGGQMPLQRRMPKLPGFTNPNRVEYTVLNVGRLAEFEDGSTVTVDDLRARGLVKHRGLVKVLGEGDIDRALTVKAHAFSLGAVEKIQAAGGAVEVVE